MLWPVQSTPPRGQGPTRGRSRRSVSRLMEATGSDVEWLDRQIQLPTRIKSSSSTLLHLLRVHGKSGQIEGGEPSSGEAILKLLTDESAGAAYFGQSPVVHTASGARFPTREKSPTDDRSLEQHRDQTLAGLGELGLPLSYPLKVGDRTASLRDVLRDSIANFHLRQEEIAWTAMAYVLYLPPIRAWANRYGERFTFDDLADELQRRPMDKESCAGIHILCALTLLARVNAEARVLSGGARPARRPPSPLRLRGRADSAARRIVAGVVESSSSSREVSHPVARSPTTT